MTDYVKHEQLGPDFFTSEKIYQHDETTKGKYDG